MFSILLIAMLLAVLLPVLNTARLMTRRTLDAAHQAAIFHGWQAYTAEHQEFPGSSALQPDWHYAGVTFARMSNAVTLDFNRPLSRYFTDNWHSERGNSIFESPLDRGITDVTGLAGTGSRTAYHAFGISFRANIFLLDARQARVDEERRPLRVNEVEVPPASMVILGAPLWYEVLEATGRSANWYGRADAGNLLFLDGSVRFVIVREGVYDDAEAAFSPVPGRLKPER